MADEKHVSSSTSAGADASEFSCALATSPGSVVHILYYTSVTNANELLETIVEKQLPLALLNPLLMPGVGPIITAAELACLSQRHKAMVTRTLHSEIVFNLSPNRNIATSLKTFGVQATGSSVVIAAVNPSAELLTTLRSNDTPAAATATAASAANSGFHVAGKLSPVSLLRQACDEALIKKTYKINAHELSIGGQTGDDLVDAVLMRVGALPIER